MKIIKNSKTIPKIEKIYQEKFDEKLKFYQIIDKYFKPLHSIETIQEHLNDMLEINIKKSTMIASIYSEIEKSKKGLSKLKYRPNAKQKNNPYRKKHKWGQSRKKYQKRIPNVKHNNINIIYNCNKCGATYQDQIYLFKNRYRIQSYTCLKCQTKGKGSIIHNNKKITIEETKIKGVYKEVINDI